MDTRHDNHGISVEEETYGAAKESETTMHELPVHKLPKRQRRRIRHSRSF